MPNIGNCDTCDYVLQCDRASVMLRSFAKALKGCPEKLVKKYLEDKEEEKKNR